MKRALLVGIDEYDHFSGLSGCVNDVRAVDPLLSRHGDGTINFSTVSKTSDAERITRDSLLKDISHLLAPGVDVALLYFAGHGVGRGDDVSICTADGTEQTPGVAMSQILGFVHSSDVPEVVVILDCCFSGAAGGSPQLGKGLTILRDGVTILAASRGDQTSAETPAGRGLFSTYLCGALEGGAAEVLGKITVAGLYAYLEESFGAWSQRPMLRANLDRLHELRRCDPAVPIAQLRRLADLFPTPQFELPLEPSYEPTEEPHDENNEADLAVLQACRAAKLVEPVDAEHLYFAAMQNKACRLTPLGQHYRLMAADQLF